MRVFVVSLRGKPLMPTTPIKARRLLKAGKAKVIRRDPFTIKLTTPTGETTQEVVGGLDTGSKTIGCAAIANSSVVYQSEVQLRSNVSKKMQQRRMYRRGRRGRKVRYRESRWANRASMRKEGRLAPSIRSKVESHLREKRFVESILPIAHWKVETCNFDIHKIVNPEVEGKGYQEGPQKDFYNVKAFILHRDGYQCQKCKAKDVPLHVHHLKFKNQGGTDAPSNLITLCKDCHDKLHRGEFQLKGVKSKTKHATEAGIVKAQLKKCFGKFEETFGYETKFKREKVLQLPKTHFNDAVAICCEEGEFVYTNNTIILKCHVSSGDYQQTKGKRSEIKIPTGKLFGFRKFDLLSTSKGIGFVKGKRSTGQFALSDLSGAILVSLEYSVKSVKSVNVKRGCSRLNARTTTLTRSSNSSAD